MITQTLLSVRLQSDLLKELDTEASLGWRKRNALINDSVRFYLKYIEARRRIRCYDNITDRLKILKVFLEDEFSDLIDCTDHELYIQ